MRHHGREDMSQNPPGTGPAKTCTFTIPGPPQHKRSGTPYHIKALDRAVMSVNRKNAPAATAIKQAALAAGWKGEAHAGAVILGCRFYFPVPKSYPKAAREKALRSYHTGMPDLDRLHNQIQDALSGSWKTIRKPDGTKGKQRKPGLMWQDDSQVCGYEKPLKRYSVNPRTEVTVWFLDDGHELPVDGELSL